MPKLDRYLSREFAQSVLAAFVVLGLISLGGVFADLLSEIARGRVPAGLMLSQLGLRIITFLPILLPLSLMLGILLAMGRLYRDSEMPVLASVGVGPKRLLRPLVLVVVPVVVVVGLCSLWLGPAALRLGERMIWDANRNLRAHGPGAGALHRAAQQRRRHLRRRHVAGRDASSRACSSTGSRATGST